MTYIPLSWRLRATHYQGELKPVDMDITPAVGVWLEGRLPGERTGGFRRWMCRD